MQLHLVLLSMYLPQALPQLQLLKQQPALRLLAGAAETLPLAPAQHLLLPAVPGACCCSHHCCCMHLQATRHSKQTVMQTHGHITPEQHQ
jgi:hypothetical protein